MEELYIEYCIFALHLGFNLEKVQYKHIEMTVWDIGGSEKIRPLWKCYYYTTHVSN